MFAFDCNLQVNPPRAAQVGKVEEEPEELSPLALAQKKESILS